MNILFISKLSGNLWAGPNNSVPAQILAQSKIDNVMWVNLNHICLPNWRREEYKFVNYDDLSDYSLENLPVPFNSPDFIIFEELYCFYPNDRMVISIIKSGIPYSIIPRSSMTLKAQRQHSIKKNIANFLFYKKFINNAKVIHYLTQSEKDESEKRFNHSSIVVPNGINIPSFEHDEFCKGSIKGVYIGRIEMNHKGLDILVNVIVSLKDLLRSVNFTMDLYGPNINNTAEKLNIVINENNITDIVKIQDGVFGNEKAEILKNTDVFIMTSRFEGMPMGMIEALAYGIPCIATKGTFLMDEIQSYNAGWGAGYTEDSIKKAFTEMISDIETFPTKSKNAIKLASNYSWEAAAEKLHDAILLSI